MDAVAILVLHVYQTNSITHMADMLVCAFRFSHSLYLCHHTDPLLAFFPPSPLFLSLLFCSQATQLWVLYLFALTMTTIAFTSSISHATFGLLLACEQFAPILHLFQASASYWSIRQRFKSWPVIGILFNRQITQEYFRHRQSLLFFFTCFSVSSAAMLTGVLVPLSRTLMPGILPYDHLAHADVIRIEAYCAVAAGCAIVQVFVGDHIVRNLYGGMTLKDARQSGQIPRPISAGMSLFARRFWILAGLMANAAIVSLMFLARAMYCFAYFFPEKYESASSL